MWFSGSGSTPPPSETPTSEFSDMPIAAQTVSKSESERIKKALMQQILVEANTASAQTLLEKMNKTCFNACVPNPGDAISPDQSKCLQSCTGNYVAAWNNVHAAFVRRLNQEANK